MKYLALILLTACASVDLTPMDLADQDMADRWWAENATHYWGATWCYGKRSGVVRISPQLRDSSEALRASILAHEHIHQQQMYELGCKKMNQMARTPDGLVSLEAPAYKAQGVSMVRTVALLSKDIKLQLVPIDSIASLVSTHWSK